MSALTNALHRAEAGLTWQYPCLIWIADYLLEETGNDPASDWRKLAWSEAVAKEQLIKLAVQGKGSTPVERALDFIANRDGWNETDIQMQGAVMIGVFNIAGEGHPAIFDRQEKWIISLNGKGWTVTGHHPDRMWSIA